jgi:polyisoprenoid-binding protein YceI
MKKSIFIVASLIAFAACKGPSGDRAKTGEALQSSTVEGESMMVDISQSKLAWRGSKPGGEHYGTIEMKQGDVKVSNGIVTGGTFVFDMNSIVCEDLTDPEFNAKLVGHLKSEDFFEVETYPEATFEIVSIEALSGTQAGAQGITPTHQVAGNLTMKDITKSVTFAANIAVDEGSVTVKTNQFLIDRTDWGVNYGSNKIFDNLADNFIHDDMGITIHLVAQ